MFGTFFSLTHVGSICPHRESSPKGNDSDLSDRNGDWKSGVSPSCACWLANRGLSLTSARHINCLVCNCKQKMVRLTTRLDFCLYFLDMTNVTLSVGHFHFLGLAFSIHLVRYLFIFLISLMIN